MNRPLHPMRFLQAFGILLAGIFFTPFFSFGLVISVGLLTGKTMNFGWTMLGMASFFILFAIGMAMAKPPAPPSH